MPPLSASLRRGGAPFPTQPYFKNPSYYPREKQQSPRSRSPPPSLASVRVDPLPGGRLPLVQRRVSPRPLASVLTTKKRRYIVEEISHVPRRYVPLIPMGYFSILHLLNSSLPITTNTPKLLLISKFLPYLIFTSPPTHHIFAHKNNIFVSLIITNRTELLDIGPRKLRQLCHQKWTTHSVFWQHFFSIRSVLLGGLLDDN